MELLGGLDKEQWLNYVIGLVPRQAAMAEHATFSLQRALNEDVSVAVAQQKVPMISRWISPDRNAGPDPDENGINSAGPVEARHDGWPNHRRLARSPYNPAG